MNNANTHMPFLLASKILDLLYVNGATYKECDDIIGMVLDQIHENKTHVEYQTCKNYVNKHQVCCADNMPINIRMNTDYIQKMVNENKSFLCDTDLDFELNK